MNAGVVQGQSSLVRAIVIVDGRLQLLQNFGEIIGAGIHRHGFPVIAGVRDQVFLLNDLRKGVEESLLFKGFLHQRLRVRLRREDIGFNELLAAVEILDHGTRGNLQSGGAGGQRERQQQAQEDVLHCGLGLLFHKNTMPAKTNMAARTVP